MLFFSKQATGLFSQRHFKKENIRLILIFFHADRRIGNKKTNRTSFAVRYNNFQGIQEMNNTRNGKTKFFRSVINGF